MRCARRLFRHWIRDVSSFNSVKPLLSTSNEFMLPVLLTCRRHRTAQIRPSVPTQLADLALSRPPGSPPGPEGRVREFGIAAGVEQHTVIRHVAYWMIALQPSANIRSRRGAPNADLHSERSHPPPNTILQDDHLDRRPDHSTAREHRPLRRRVAYRILRCIAQSMSGTFITRAYREALISSRSDFLISNTGGSSHLRTFLIPHVERVYIPITISHPNTPDD